MSPIETMEIGGGRRLALCPEALYVEAKGPAGWLRSRAIHYGEIRALYSYQVRDWTSLLVAGGAWMGLTILLLVAGAVLTWPGEMLAVLVLLAGVLIGSAALYRVLTAPRKMLRIEAFSGALVVPDRAPAFFRTLSERLPQSRPQPAAPGAAPAVDVPPAGEWRVEGLDDGENSGG
jgi:hypothetical protein